MVESKEAMLAIQTQKAREKKEQASHRAQQATREYNEKIRIIISHHKYMMGGVIVKYFPDAYCFNEEEWNILLEAALKSADFKAKEKAIRDKFEAQKKTRMQRARKRTKNLLPESPIHLSTLGIIVPAITAQVVDSPLYTKAKIPHSPMVSAHR